VTPKVMVVGVFKDGTGFTQGSTNLVLSLDSVGVDVVPRTVKLNGINGEVPQRILDLEQKSAQGCNVVIQHLLPNMMKFERNCGINIATLAPEAAFEGTNWSEHLNLMDEVWVQSEYSRRCCLDSGVNAPVRNVQHAFDIDRYTRSYGKIDLPPGFKFYAIADFNRRKNLGALLRAFHTEFAPEENVQLIVKVSSAQLDARRLGQELVNMSNEIKRSLKLYPNESFYKKEVFIPDFCSNEKIYELHNSCDCFVNSSMAEGWSVPTFEAMAFGKGVIAPRSTGFLEYLTDDNSYLVDVYEEPCFSCLDTLPYLYTAREDFYVPSINGLRKAMRRAYANQEEMAQKARQAVADSQAFSLETIGAKLRGILGEFTTEK
jgi:glycosyltransferase involved in cell wall biosynthesis